MSAAAEGIEEHSRGCNSHWLPSPRERSRRSTILIVECGYRSVEGRRPAVVDDAEAVTVQPFSSMAAFHWSAMSSISSWLRHTCERCSNPSTSSRSSHPS